MENRDKIVIGVGLVGMLLTIMVGFTYAFWKLTKVQESENVIVSSCLNLMYTDGDDAINLTSAEPLSDEDGARLVPYTFSVQNTCANTEYYQISMEMLTGTTLASEYVKAIFDGETKNLSTYAEGEIKAGGIENRILTSGSLTANQKKDYSIILYIDGETAIDANSMNKSFKSKIVVDGSLKEFATTVAKTEFENTVKLGDYVTMTPTLTSYTISSTETSDYSDYILNPNTLTTWRVFNILDNGDIELISDRVEDNYVYLRGKTSYLNYANILQNAAAAYQNTAYTKSARSFGYNGQTLVVPNTAFESGVPWTEEVTNNEDENLGRGDNYYLKDYNQLTTAGISAVAYSVSQNQGHVYAASSRIYNSFMYSGTQYYQLLIVRVSENGYISEGYAYQAASDYSVKIYIRPIVTLKNGLNATGTGTEADPWIFE